MESEWNTMCHGIQLPIYGCSRIFKCIWFTWQGFSSSGFAGVTSVVKGCPMPVTEHSKTDPLLAKDEPISKAGGVPIKAYLKKDKKCHTAREGGGKKNENSSANTKIRGEGGGISLKSMVEQIFMLQPMEGPMQMDVY